MPAGGRREGAGRKPTGRPVRERVLSTLVTVEQGALIDLIVARQKVSISLLVWVAIQYCLQGCDVCGSSQHLQDLTRKGKRILCATCREKENP